MFKPWKFILFFLLCLALSLLFNLPIQQVLPHLKMSDSVRLAGVDGTLLKGRVESITVDDFPVRGVRYRFLPSCIALLKVCYRVDYREGRIELAYDLLNGDTEINRSQLDYPVAQLLMRLPTATPFRPGGRLQLEIDELSMLDNKLVAVNGRLIWRHLGVDQDEIQVDIGDYRVGFAGTPESYEFEFDDLDAALDVTGGGVVTADGNYQLDVRVASQSAIDPQVRSLLELIGKRGAGGNTYRIERQGQLRPNVTRQLFR